MKYCENCGEQLPDKAKFCGKCGQAQEVFVAPAVEHSEPKEDKRETMKCPYCLETILKGAKICRFCRSDLTEEKTEIAQNVVVSKSSRPSLNWRSFVCICFHIVQIAIIALAFTPLLFVGINVGYSGYSIYNHSVGLSVFSCFDLSDMIGMISSAASSFTGDNMSNVICAVGIALIGLIFMMFVSEIARLVDVYRYYQKHNKIGFDGYNIAFPLVFTAIIVILCTYISSYFTNSDIPFAEVELSPTMIIIIVLLCIQIAMNIIVAWNDNSKDDRRCRSCGILRRYVDSEAIWICAMCFKSNSQKLDYCEYCGYPRPSLRHKDTAEVNGYVAEESLTWFCKCCLTYNSQLRISCKTCGMSRKLSDELWICSRCLKTNPVSSDCCEHCGEVSHLIQLAKQEDKE